MYSCCIALSNSPSCIPCVKESMSSCFWSSVKLSNKAGNSSVKFSAASIAAPAAIAETTITRMNGSTMSINIKIL